jgi:hypothetical protein
MTKTYIQADHWHKFIGSQHAITNSREHLAELSLGDNSGTDNIFVVGGKNHFYANLDPKFLRAADKAIKQFSVTRTEEYGRIEYETAFCGLNSASVKKHQFACNACRSIKRENEDWSKETLDNEIAKTTTVHFTPLDPTLRLEVQPDVQDATAMLASFISMAEKHREEHRVFVAKWHDYVTSLQSLQTDIQESSRQLKEAQIRFDKNTSHIAALLQTGEDD